MLVAGIVLSTLGALIAPETTKTTSDLEERSSELRPIRHDTLFREHEVSGDATFKPGKGLEFRSSNGRFSLATRLRAQFLYTMESATLSPQTTHGLQIRRARLQFKGHFWNKHNRFKTELAFSPRDEGLKDGMPHRTPILDWYLDFTYLRDLTLRVGQYKVPYSRQRVVSSGDLQLVDRSTANGEFNLDRDIGVDLRSKDLFGLGHLRYYAGVYMGEGRDQFEMTNFDMVYLARLEVLPFGIFKDYAEVDFERTLKPRLSVGAAYSYVDGATRTKGIRGSIPSDGGTTDFHNATADLMFKFGGLSIFADVFYRQGRRHYGNATLEDESGNIVVSDQEAARNGIGWSAQAGVLIPRTFLELAGRFAQVRPTTSSSLIETTDEVGGGASYYFAGHPMKLQLDYFAHVNEQQWHYPDNIVRLQLQAAF